MRGKELSNILSELEDEGLDSKMVDSLRYIIAQGEQEEVASGELENELEISIKQLNAAQRRIFEDDVLNNITNKSLTEKDIEDFLAMPETQEMIMLLGEINDLEKTLNAQSEIIEQIMVAPDE